MIFDPKIFRTHIFFGTYIYVFDPNSLETKNVLDLNFFWNTNSFWTKTTVLPNWSLTLKTNSCFLLFSNNGGEGQALDLTLTLPWPCLDLALTLTLPWPWPCLDPALTLPWPFLDLALTLPWPWPCLDLDLALTLHWPCLGPAFKVRSKSCQ